jgi:hypothetical protein
MTDTIDTILADVTDETTVEQALIVLLAGLDAQLKSAGTDAAKIAAVRSRIASNKAAMVAAVLANTPAASTSTTGAGPTGAGPTVIPASVSVANGSSVQLAVDDSTGADITSTAVYATADPTVASVSTAGLVTGNKAGTTSLTVTDASGNATKVSVVVS